MTIDEPTDSERAARTSTEDNPRQAEPTTIEEDTDHDPAATPSTDRRTFLELVASITGASALGLAETDVAGAATATDPAFVNWRVREAAHAWDRGYRGRPDRTIGLTDTGVDARHPDVGPWNGVRAVMTSDGPDLRGGDDPFADVDPDNVTPDTPTVVGWYNETDRYGEYSSPRDPHGHGTHVSSTMGGTGRASAIDSENVVEDDPHAVLLAGDVLAYEVTASAGTGVYGSAYGDFIEILVEGPDGKTIARSNDELTDDLTPDDASLQDNVVVATPTVHDAGAATYTVYVRPYEGEFVSSATVERVSAGAFHSPDETVGDRTTDGDGTVHAGLAPNQSIVGLQGLGEPFEDLGAHSDWFADTFNLRAVNMSWGYLGGVPFGYVFGDHAVVRQIAEGGIAPVAAAGNSGTPANSSEPAVADEAISVVATGPLDGIASYSSGGVGYFDPENGEIYRKPDVTAPGGMLTDLINAAKAGDPDLDESEQSPIRDYTGMAGTSMASPYVTGTVGLVSEAMESDAAPERIRLPTPANTGKADVLRLKQAVLATASESALTAAPYHRAHTPTYDFGARDSYEGFGRVNPGAAVDAVTRSLSGTSSEVVGLDVPADERAAAGHVEAGPGAFEVTVEFSHYSGGNKGATKGDPHVDLFVYDAENPDEFGEPNVVTRGQGLTGDVSVSVTTDEPRTFYVVAKLVNVPGVVNGVDVQAHLDLTVDVLQDFTVSGTREDDGSVFTGGQTDQIDIAIDASEAVELRDVVPTEWVVLEDYGDVSRVETVGDVQHVYFTGDAAEARSVTYFAEAPDDTALTGEYVLGPAEVRPSGENRWYGVRGTTDTNTVVAEET